MTRFIARAHHVTLPIISQIHVKSWKQKPPQKFISYLASNTVGFCGCDLQALCTEAVMCCLRRNYPQIYSTKSKYHVNQRSLQVRSSLDIVLLHRRVLRNLNESCDLESRAYAP